MPLLLMLVSWISQIGVWVLSVLVPFFINLFISRFIYSSFVTGLIIAFYASVLLVFMTFLNTRFVTLLDYAGFFDNPYFLTGVSLLPSNVISCISVFGVVYVTYIAFRFKVFIAKIYFNHFSGSSGIPGNKRLPGQKRIPGRGQPGLPSPDSFRFPPPG